MATVSPHISNNHPKCKWINLANQKTQSGWMDKEQDPPTCCLQETHLNSKDKHRRNMKVWKTILQANGNQRKIGVAILISDKCKPNITKKGQNRHSIMSKRLISKEDITIIYMLQISEHQNTSVTKRS